MTAEDFIHARKEFVASSETPKLIVTTRKLSRQLQDGLASYGKTKTYSVSYQHIVMNGNLIFQGHLGWVFSLKDLFGS